MSQSFDSWALIANRRYGEQSEQTADSKGFALSYVDNYGKTTRLKIDLAVGQSLLLTYRTDQIAFQIKRLNMYTFGVARRFFGCTEKEVVKLRDMYRYGYVIEQGKCCTVQHFNSLGAMGAPKNIARNASIARKEA